MTSYLMFKVVHVMGIALIFLAIGAAFAGSNTKQKQAGILHGVGLLIILVSGIPLIMSVTASSHGWLAVKFVIWLVLGGLLTMMKKKPDQSNTFAILAILLAGIAAYFALFKPF
jgi:hypothetical protein